MSAVQVGFLGAGKMATALAAGLIDSGFASPEQVTAVDVLPSAATSFGKATGANVLASHREVLKKANVLFFAVKPQSLPELLDEIKAEITPQHLLVSIIAGATISQFEAVLGNCRIVRVMPNTPCLLKTGASGFALGKHATSEDGQLVSQMLSTVGVALEVPEKSLDAVTGLSGSGPAYVFEMIEALSDGGVLVGLPRATATQLAAQTLMGAARMVLETGEHPGQLKDAVTSPGGTTIAGLHVLEQAGMRGILMNAVLAATEQAKKLGQACESPSQKH